MPRAGGSIGASHTLGVKVAVSAKVIEGGRRRLDTSRETCAGEPLSRSVSRPCRPARSRYTGWRRPPETVHHRTTRPIAGHPVRRSRGNRHDRVRVLSSWVDGPGASPRPINARRATVHENHRNRCNGGLHPPERRATDATGLPVARRITDIGGESRPVRGLRQPVRVPTVVRLRIDPVVSSASFGRFERVVYGAPRTHIGRNSGEPPEFDEDDQRDGERGLHDGGGQ